MKYAESGSGYSHSVGYSYDDLNNLTKLVETINGTGHTTSYAYDTDNRVTSVTNGSSQKSYTYDGFGRIGSRVSKHGSTTVLTDTITYRSPSSGKTSGQVATLKNAAAGYNTTYTYTYDANGNIKTVNDGSYTTTYTYDSQNQLIREDNQAAGKSWTWSYDAGGNITSKKEYAYTTGTLGAETGTATYVYDSGWGDLLISYNGVALNNDEIGNPAALNGRSYVWEHGRELRKVTYANTEWTNTYDVNGLRAKREGGGKTYSYTYNGSLLSRMTVGSDTLTFFYDASGNPLSLIHNGTTYYYATNLQGDVVAILNASGTAVVTYTYDAWGKLLSTGGDLATTLGVLNPLRYRGYVYDVETELYYLQSRYYDPEMGRFISADALVSTGQGLLGNNMFAYCRNNPVCRKDITGTTDVATPDDGTELLDEEKTFNGGTTSTGGFGGNGSKISGGQSSPSPNTGNGYNTGHSIGTGHAPKQGASGSTYTQISSDGKGQTVSVTTYGAYDRPFTRVDYQGRDHNVGLPHIHRFGWGYYNGGIRRTGETVVPYIKE